MAARKNYRFERAERARQKAAKREAKREKREAKKAERDPTAEAHQGDPVGNEPTAPADEV
jgi:hypothetical protein